MSKPIAPHAEPATRFTALTRPHRNPCREPAYPPLTLPAEAMPSNRPDLYSWIDLLAESVRVRTSAIGAAVALTAGDELRCCGSAGTAPPKGVVVSEESTLAGECVRTGRTIRCVDAVSNGISAASALLAPILQRGEVIGVLGLFWCDPHAISDANVVIANAAASMISASLGGTCGAGGLAPRRPMQLDADVDDRREEAIPVAVQSGGENAHRQPAVSKPLGVVRKLYGLPCAKCGSYFFSDETSCPICHASVVS